jgi:hypothetical protein
VSGLLLLLALVALCAGALYLLGVRSGMLYIASGTLFLGAAGYALQGRPDLRGSPRGTSVSAQAIPLTTLRRAFYGQFTPHEHWMIIADSYTRRGATADAVGVLKTAAATYPNDPSLWVALGNALVDHAGALTPPADGADFVARHACQGARQRKLAADGRGCDRRAQRPGTGAAALVGAAGLFLKRVDLLRRVSLGQ